MSADTLPTVTATDTVDRLVDVVATLVPRLRDVTPPPEDWDALVQLAFTDRGGRLRVRSRNPKGLSRRDLDRVNALRHRMDWHAGRNVTLYGPILDTIALGDAEADRIDTLALLVLIALGHAPSVGARVWARALGHTA